MVAFKNSDGDHTTQSKSISLGHRLPISWSYARYFGGHLSIMSMEGYNIDAFVSNCLRQNILCFLISFICFF